jgi:hypothetical protein
MADFTSHREKMREEKHLKAISESHSCICAECGRKFPEENENGHNDSDISDSENMGQPIESEDNS